MKHQIIAGGAGVPLHVMETGESTGRSILFIHGSRSARSHGAGSSNRIWRTVAVW